MFRTVDCNEHKCQASERFELETFGKEAIILSFITLLRGNPSKVTAGVSNMDAWLWLWLKRQRDMENKKKQPQKYCVHYSPKR